MMRGECCKRRRALLPLAALMLAACADPSGPAPVVARQVVTEPGGQVQEVVRYGNGDMDTFRGGRLFVRVRGDLATLYVNGRSRTVNLADVRAQLAQLAAHPSLASLGLADNAPPSHYFAGDRPGGEGGGAACFDEGIKLAMTATAATAALWALDSALIAGGVTAPVGFAFGIALLAYTGSAVGFVNCMDAASAGGGS